MIDVQHKVGGTDRGTPIYVAQGVTAYSLAELAMRLGVSEAEFRIDIDHAYRRRELQRIRRLTRNKDWFDKL